VIIIFYFILVFFSPVEWSWFWFVISGLFEIFAGLVRGRDESVYEEGYEDAREEVEAESDYDNYEEIED